LEAEIIVGPNRLIYRQIIPQPWLRAQKELTVQGKCAYTFKYAVSILWEKPPNRSIAAAIKRGHKGTGSNKAPNSLSGGCSAAKSMAWQAIKCICADDILGSRAKIFSAKICIYTVWHGFNEAFDLVHNESMGRLMALAINGEGTL
jgi:hypothetical protein